MTGNYTRPVNIIAHNADMHGCGWHRMMKPLEVLVRSGLAFGRIDMALFNDEQLQIMKPDVVVWQRQHEAHHIDNIRRYRAALPKAFIVYELDDALSEVPDWSFHNPFIPTHIQHGIAEAANVCDAVTVSTRSMARYMKSIGVTVDIRVAPNMLGRDDFSNAGAVRQANRRPHVKARIGWGGGISHAGDLQIIAPVVEALADRVEWVFVGMKPEVKVPVDFNPGAPPHEYLARLASLDLDLMIAPLVEHEFNRCKSNLRLIEGGACGYPVIASPIEPYTENNPPVVAYCDPQPEAWIAAIEKFLELDPQEQFRHAMAMKQWAERHFCLDDRAEERLKYWLPEGRKPFRPARNRVSSKSIAIVNPPADGKLFDGCETVIYPTLKAAVEGPYDIVYLRPGTTITAAQIERMRQRMHRQQAASISPFSNDTGVVGFPNVNRFTPMVPDQGLELDGIAAAEFADLDVNLMFPAGPCMMISRRALDQWGAPIFEENTPDEAVLYDWGMMISTRGMRHKAAADTFVATANPPPTMDYGFLGKRMQMCFPQPQDIPHDPMAPIRTKLELAYMKAKYRVPFRPQNVAYAEWCDVMDEPGIRDRIAMKSSIPLLAHKPKFALVLPAGGYATIEPQTYPNFVKIDGETEIAAALEAAVKADALWTIFLRDNVTVRGHALYMLALESADPMTAIVYSDHDVIDKAGGRSNPDFKPNFDHELLLHRDYITPFCAIRTSVALSAVRNGAPIKTGLYALILDIILNHTKSGQMVSAALCRHVHRILAHLAPRAREREFQETRIRAVTAQQHAETIGWRNLKIAPHPTWPEYARVSYQPIGEPKVSIIIPTKNKRDMLEPCINTLLRITKYQNYEILVVDNGSTAPLMLEYFEKLKAMPKIRLVHWPEAYNWSKLNNWAADQVDGEFLLLLNDDTRIDSADWLSEMVGCAQRPEVGVVGARLLFPHGLVQHVGVVCREGLTGHMHKGLPAHAPGYHGIAVLSHEAAAVTGACLMIRRDRFYEIGKIDESLVHNFNDVALCLSLRQKGWLSIVAATAEVQHLEGQTRLAVMSPEGSATLKAESQRLVAKFPEDEPYWNKNLSIAHFHQGLLVQGMDMNLYEWPPAPWPWRSAEWPNDRVIVIGDDGRASRHEMREGNGVYLAGLEGYKIKIENPVLENTAPADIRHPAQFRQILAQLSINRIILRSIDRISLDVLGFLMHLGVPVEYRPYNGQAVCPMGDFKVAGKACGNAWRDHACQACIDKNGSQFGYISIIGWVDTWKRFLEGVQIDDSELHDDARTAIGSVYPRQSLADAAKSL